MNEKNLPSSKAPAPKSENAWPGGSVKFQKNGERSCSTRHSALREAKFAEFENETIQKQRQEMQHLIAELRSRDRELNEMVAVHRKQLLAWEQDRSRIAALDEKCSRYERELHGRNDEIYSLMGKLRAIESEEENRQVAIRNKQDQLNSVTEQHCLTSQRLSETQEVNRGLSRTIQELKSAAGQHEHREQELYQLLSSKDRDLSEAASHIAEIIAKLKRCEFQLQESHQGNSDLKRQVSEWRNKHAELSREVDHAKKQNAKLEEFSAKQRSDVQQLRQQLITACSEITMFDEREQRKEELLQLQKSKQDRTDAELAALRELCEIQQRDISLLQMSLDTAKNLLNSRQKSFNQDRSSVNYSYSQMLLPSQSDTSSFCDSPIRSYLKKSSSASTWKDTDAADSNINNHANLLLSRYSALRVSESSKVSSWSSQNFSVPFTLERKTYTWQGGRSVGDAPEKQLTVELDESPTKDVMSSDLEKDSKDVEKDSVGKVAERTLKMNFVENRVEISGSSSNHRSPSRVASPSEGLSAPTRTLGVSQSRGSWQNPKPCVVTSSNKISPGGRSSVELSYGDVVRDEVSMEDHVSVDKGNVEIPVVEESKKEEGKLVDNDYTPKREGCKNMENEESRLRMNSATPLTALRGEKLLRRSSVVEEEEESIGGCVENGRMLANEGVRIASNQDNSENYAVRLSSPKDDDIFKHAEANASNFSSTENKTDSPTGNYCPSKFSSTSDVQTRNSSPAMWSSTKDEVGVQSVDYRSSKFSSTKDETESRTRNSTPSKFSSHKDEATSPSGTYCPFKFSSTKDETIFQSENYCPFKFSSTKDETSFQSGSYCPFKLSSTKDEAGCQSLDCHSSRLCSSEEGDGRSRPESPKLSAVSEDRSNFSVRSLSKEDSDSELLSDEFSSHVLLAPLENDSDSSLKGHGGSKLDINCPPKVSLPPGHSGPESEKSRASSVSSVDQYSIQSLPAYYGSIGKTGEVKFKIPTYHSGRLSTSYEKLSETVGKDWARSCTWNSTTGEPIALRPMSSYIGLGRVAGQQEVKVDLKEKSEAISSGERDSSRQDFGKGAVLQQQPRNVIDILVENKCCAPPSSGTISESSSHLDVYCDALA